MDWLQPPLLLLLLLVIPGPSSLVKYRYQHCHCIVSASVRSGRSCGRIAGYGFGVVAALAAVAGESAGGSWQIDVTWTVGLQRLAFPLASHGAWQ